jgi:hypothetical protein
VLTVVRNKGKLLPLKKKLHVIRGYKSDELMLDIANAMGTTEATLRTTRKQAEEILERCKSAKRMTANKITEIRTPIMEKSERLLEIGNQCAIVDIDRTVGSEDTDGANVEKRVGAQQ